MKLILQSFYKQYILSYIKIRHIITKDGKDVNMNVKLIAVDMDGTFLTNNNEYDQERFTRQYEFMKEKGIHFVVASGNQYYQLRSFFPDIHNELAFIAENGAYIVDQGKECFCLQNLQKRIFRQF